MLDDVGEQMGHRHRVHVHMSHAAGLVVCPADGSREAQKRGTGERTEGDDCEGCSKNLLDVDLHCSGLRSQLDSKSS